MTSLTDIDGSVFAYEFDGEGNRLSQSLNDCLSKRFVYAGPAPSPTKPSALSNQHSGLAPFPCLGLVQSGSSSAEGGFFNDWENFSGANGPVFGLSSGFANGMRLEGGFPERKWKARKSARGSAEGK